MNTTWKNFGKRKVYKMHKTVIVSTNDGQVRGIEHQSPYFDDKFNSFYGVPYAEPPVGNLRFRDPIEVKPWKSIRDATIEKEGCPQFSLHQLRFMGSEDCLYVNIHTPTLPSSPESLKAVIVLIHAGGLLWGSADSAHHGSPNFIMNRDVVYVTIGYRLNIFGFLNLEMKSCSGNQALKDIILALKWIKKNIKFFNGDPENVTMMGGSSGAVLVNLLMLSPSAQGLFHKAIVLGTFTFNCLIVNRDEQKQLAFDYARQLGFNRKNVRELLAFLKSLPAMTIVESMRHFLKNVLKKTVKAAYGSVFFAVVDYGENAVIPVSPRELVESMKRVPLIFGICDRESLVAFTSTAIKATKENFNTWYRHNSWAWTYSLTDEEIDEIRRQIDSFYTENFSNTNSSLSIKEMILTDAIFSEVYDTLINPNADELPSSTYVYKFQYEGEMTASKTVFDLIMVEKFTGTYHFDDFNYWAQMAIIPMSDESMDMVYKMTKIFTNFAKHGNPNFKNMEVQWEPSTPTEPCYLSIDKTLTMVDGKLNKERSDFWDKLLEKYRKDKF